MKNKELFMKRTVLSEEQNRQIVRLCSGVLCFLLLATGVFFWLWNSVELPYSFWARAVYLLGSSCLLAGLCVGGFALFVQEKRAHRPLWFCPLAAAGLSLCLMLLSYAQLGVWPLGEKSVMLVDMHHQYAPLLSELRDRLLSGTFGSYSFHIGLGANFIPAFAYYLASPLNLLLLLFPERLLCEGILLITLLKNALTAACFAACAQYVLRRRNAIIVTLAVMYSMMGYMLAYSWNIMWLDGVALLPAVVLGLEYMLRRGRFLPYTLLLALALFANYYIGFMLCVFLVLYFLLWLLRQRRDGVTAAAATLRFGGASLLAGGLVAALLVPTALALSQTSAAGEGLPELAANFPLFELFERFFYGATPTIRSGNLPNLYCGTLAVLLLPIFLTDRSLPLRRRVAESSLLAVLMLSCTVNQWDLIWHGLHTPNDLPYRFSFLACFVLLLMAGRTLCRMERLQPKTVLWSLAGCVAYLVLWEKLDEELSAQRLYACLLLLALYAAVLLLTACRRLPVRMGRLAVLVLVTAELLLSSGQTLLTMNDDEYYTNHSAYVDNDTTAATAAAVRRAQELAAAEGQTFSRMEYLPRSTCMDTALHHYNGVTTFASSNPYGITTFMGQLGYAINGVNSYLYHSFVPASDALLGLRYIVLGVKLTNHAQLELLETVTVNDISRYIYKNRLALPIGMAADSEALHYTGRSYAPFLCQEQLYTALLGEEANLYDGLDIAALSGGSVNADSFNKSSSVNQGVFSATVELRGQYFAYVDCSAADSIQVTSYRADGTQRDSFSVTPYEPYIIDLGTLSSDERVEVTVEGEGALTGHIYVTRLRAERLTECVEKLSAGGLQITEASDTKIQGTMTATKDGAAVFSIPYDAGWRVTVDGQTVETQPVGCPGEGGGFLAVELSAGTHEIQLTYHAPGLVAGMILSGVSLALLLLWWLWERRHRCRH